MMATRVSLSPGGPGRRASQQHRCASALAAAARPGGGGHCSERPRTSTSSSSRRRQRRSWRPRSSRQTWWRYYLWKISRTLRNHKRSVGKPGSSSPSSSSTTASAVDDDAARRERAEAVARAISYCKDTLRRSPPPPSPSPSLDDWLDDRDRQEVIAIASAAELHCHGYFRAASWDDSRPSPKTTTRPHRDRETRAKRFNELQCSAPASLPSRREYRSLAATAAVVAHGEESPHHAHRCHGESMMSSMDELEFLKTFDGDEEMIDRHFITVEIPRSGSQVLRKQSPPDTKKKRSDTKRRKISASVVVPSTLNVFQELEN